METVKQDGRMNTENYQQRKLRQALLMKRLTNFIPLVGTAVLAALFFAVCIVKGYEIDTNLIVVIKRAMIIGFWLRGRPLSLRLALLTCPWAPICWSQQPWVPRYIMPRAALS